MASEIIAKWVIVMLSPDTGISLLTGHSTHQGFSQKNLQIASHP
jgi:hypothetical protein